MYSLLYTYVPVLDVLLKKLCNVVTGRRFMFEQDFRKLKCLLFGRIVIRQERFRVFHPQASQAFKAVTVSCPILFPLFYPCFGIQALALIHDRSSRPFPSRLPNRSQNSVTQFWFLIWQHRVTGVQTPASPCFVAQMGQTLRCFRRRRWEGKLISSTGTKILLVGVV